MLPVCNNSDFCFFINEYLRSIGSFLTIDSIRTRNTAFIFIDSVRANLIVLLNNLHPYPSNSGIIKNLSNVTLVNAIAAIKRVLYKTELKTLSPRCDTNVTININATDTIISNNDTPVDNNDNLLEKLSILDFDLSRTAQTTSS